MIYHRHVVGTSVIQYCHDEKQIDRSQRNRFWRMGKKPHANVGNDSHQPMEASYVGANKLIAQWFLQQGKSLPQANRKLAPLFFRTNGRSSWWVWKNSFTSNYVAMWEQKFVVWQSCDWISSENMVNTPCCRQSEGVWSLLVVQETRTWGRVNSMDPWILDFT